MITTMAVDSLPPITESPRHRSGCWRLLGIFLALGLILGGFMAWKFMDVTKAAMAWITENAVTQDINETFRQSVTQIVSTKGDILEVATMETDETITKYDMKSIFNQTVYLGTTISEIRTPVVYRYHIKLSDGWQLRVDGNQCIVHAPALRPSQPPAIRTEGMQKKSEAGWLRFNAAESLAELEKNLTPTLEKRAGNRSHLNLIRESARKSVAEFVKKWLLTQERNSMGEIDSITVIFPDEIPPNGEPRTMPPTVLVP
ncbi:MAG: hypothetical protein OJI67_21825 [Prosthecobacter sp.]|nr:hypothetical protein [Prosthecobacter sp.]